MFYTPTKEWLSKPSTTLVATLDFPRRDFKDWLCKVRYCYMGTPRRDKPTTALATADFLKRKSKGIQVR